ncbi:MAG: hypothetical protein RL654_2736 [Pseudomonadota bacterium]|jgi:hypothetical protein
MTWRTDNHRIPQKALEHRSTVQTIKQWQVQRPELFRKRVYEPAGLDTYLARMYASP